MRMWGNLCSDDHPLLVLVRDLTLQYNYRVTAKDPMTLHRISQQRHAMIREADA
ncbi:hypothetical protein [Nocardia carnea]|uniref:hypothetical protein n=1 Tax=Nocardia carnea TaxID=37328 RepID=UPI0012DD1DFB|nr:hypothetical protein [Nocardia carnea]